MKILNANYEKIKQTHDKATYDAFCELQSLYTDGIYKWYASLWEPDIGGFYYSLSARDTEGFLPDIESTAQLLGYVEELGLVPNLIDLPEGMKKKLIAFLQGLQDKDDGYFYHPQWGKEVTDGYLSRRARDLSRAVSVLNTLGASPTYDTPTGTKGDGVLADGNPIARAALTSPLGGSAVAAVSAFLVVRRVVVFFSPSALAAVSRDEDFLTGAGVSLISRRTMAVRAGMYSST